MGLMVSVYRDSGMYDCTNGGITANHKRLTVVNVPGPFKPTADRPAALLVKGPLGDPTVVPAVQDATGEWVPEKRPGIVGPMAGGNYVATSDSRWRQAVGFYGAVPVHDRFETVEQYERLSQ